MESYYDRTRVEIEKNAAMMMMSQIKAIVVLVPYRGMCGTGRIYMMATTVRLHTRPAPPRLLGIGTAQQSVATSMTMSRQYSGRMVDSPAVGTLWRGEDPQMMMMMMEEGVLAAESVFQTSRKTRVLLPGVEKKCCNDDESVVLV